jgi:hypothetical protein
MPDVAERVLEQTKLFHRALPELLHKYRGRWVVFVDGQVKGVHASEEEAYGAAVQAYGPNGGFVIAPVVELTPMSITAAVAFDRA